jgi:hypothetical protein
MNSHKPPAAAILVIPATPAASTEPAPTEHIAVLAAWASSVSSPNPHLAHAS